MKSRTLRSFLAIAFGSIAFAACAPTANNNEVPNALVANPRTLNLTPTTNATSTLALNCGCRYKLTITSVTGDTAAIHYTTTEPLDSMSTSHHVVLSAVSNASRGIHTLTMAFYAPDDNNQTFTDTVRTTLNVP